MQQRVDYARVQTGGTESPSGNVAWTVTVRCHGRQYQEDFFMGRQQPDLNGKAFSELPREQTSPVEAPMQPCPACTHTDWTECGMCKKCGLTMDEAIRLSFFWNVGLSAFGFVLAIVFIIWLLLRW